MFMYCPSLHVTIVYDLENTQIVCSNGYRLVRMCIYNTISLSGLSDKLYDSWYVTHVQLDYIFLNLFVNLK